MRTERGRYGRLGLGGGGREREGLDGLNRKGSNIFISISQVEGIQIHMTNFARGLFFFFFFVPLLRQKRQEIISSSCKVLSQGARYGGKCLRNVGNLSGSPSDWAGEVMLPRDRRATSLL